LVAALLGLVFSVIGALRVAHADAAGILKGSAGTGLDLSRRRPSAGVIVGEVALSVVLLVGAGLLIATFVNLRSIHLGFDTANVVAVQLAPGAREVATPDVGTVRAARRLARGGAMPGVTGATTATPLPLERG